MDCSIIIQKMQKCRLNLEVIHLSKMDMILTLLYPTSEAESFPFLWKTLAIIVPVTQKKRRRRESRGIEPLHQKMALPNSLVEGEI